MRYGITMFTTDRSMDVRELAQEAEARGLESLWLPEHTHIPVGRRTPPPTGEAELPGHLAAEDGAKEVAGSDSFVPADKKDDKQLLYAIDLLNGVRKDAAFKATSTASAN